MNSATPLTDASAKLAEQILKWTKGVHQLTTEISGLRLSHWNSTTPPTNYNQNASICLVAQGAKRVLLGDENYHYDANHFLVSSINLPLIANIVSASEEKPFLGLVLELDLQVISQLIVDGNFAFRRGNNAAKGIAVGALTPTLLDAFIRLMALLDNPRDIAILAPAIKREIFYRLLSTPQGIRLNQIVTTGSHSHQIASAIDWLKHNFAAPLNVGQLAADAGMSKSAFYSHFRSMTSMTPLQYQKKLRLNEARRLMLTEHLDATGTTFRVGYESPSQFSREYSRMFGAPPYQDIKNLRNAAQLENSD